jgi:pimeloyl-ACP methyl ester carboxylesterase
MGSRFAGFDTTVDAVDERPVRSLSRGVRHGLPEVVLVPGLGAPGYLAPFARAVSGWTRVTVVDLPGWRWGRARSCAPGLDGIARCIPRWLAATGRDQVVLLGHSTAAQAVARAARDQPEVLAGAVLAGPTFAPPARRAPALVRRALATAPHESLGELPAVLPSYLHSGVAALVRMLDEAMDDPLHHVVAAVAVPTLVLVGAHDALAPPGWARTLADVASAQVEIVPGGHNFCYRHPHRASEVVRATVRAWAGSAAKP